MTRLIIGTLLGLAMTSALAQPKPLTIPNASGKVFIHNKPAEGVEVFIVEQDAALENVPGGSTKRTVTDKAGKYSIPGPWRATDHVVARKAGMTSAPALIGTGQKIVVDRPGSTISGSVKRDDGASVAGILVILSARLSGAFCTTEETQTDAKGHYRFSNENGDFDDFSVSAMPDRSGYQEGSGYFYLEPGQNRQLPQITVRTRDGVVEGTVIDAHGHPVSGVNIFPGVNYVQTKTDPSGHFRLAGLARGDVGLDAETDDGAQGEAVTKTGNRRVVIKLESAPPTPSRPSTPPSAPVVPADIGQTAPQLQISDWLDKKPISIAGCKGKVVVLDFWFTSCGPCIKEFPEMQKLYRRYQSKGVVVLGVCFPDSQAKIRRLLNKAGVTYPNAIDKPSHSDLPTTASHYPFVGTPNLVVIDQNGRIAWNGPDVEGAEHSIRRQLGLFR